MRDLLYVSHLIEAFDKFIKSDLEYAVFNIGGDPKNTTSLLEFLDILEKETGKRNEITFSNWTPSDQKVYISDISKVRKTLNWEPQVSPKEEINELINAVREHKDIF